MIPGSSPVYIGARTAGTRPASNHNNERTTMARQPVRRLAIGACHSYHSRSIETITEPIILAAQ